MALHSAKIISIVGATASGKTAAGIEIALKIRGEIISSDSMQIYRYMDVGTAKPTQEERSQVPHHLIDILNPDEHYNAGKFQLDADKTIASLQRDDKNSIVLGGTGLYLRALLYGIIQVPDITRDTKEQVNRIFSEEGLPGCYQRLTELDPISAGELHPNDISRIFRALEVVLETGQSIKLLHEKHRFLQQRYPAFLIGVYRTREELYRRINERVHKMVEEGLIEETEALLKKNYSPDLPSLKSIGYKQAVAYLKGKMDKERMIEEIQQKSRIYAKKQITWYRKNKDIHWVTPGESLEPLIEKVRHFLQQ